MEKLTLTVEEFAGMMNISRPKAYEMTHIQGFPVLTVGRKRLILLREIDSWLSKRVAGEQNAEA